MPHGRKPKPGIVLHRSRLIHPDDRSSVRGIPVTSIARTLVDLADVVSEERLAKAVHEAEVQRVFDLGAVDAVVRRLPGRKGRHKLRRVLAAYQPEPRFLRSEAERRFKRLCESHSLPQPQFNVNIAGHEVDAYWEDAKHRRGDRRRRDPPHPPGLPRGPALAIAGWPHWRFAW